MASLKGGHNVWWCQGWSSLAKSQPGVTAFRALQPAVCVEFLTEYPLKNCFLNTRINIRTLVKFKTLCSLLLFLWTIWLRLIATQITASRFFRFQVVSLWYHIYMHRAVLMQLLIPGNFYFFTYSKIKNTLYGYLFFSLQLLYFIKYTAELIHIVCYINFCLIKKSHRIAHEKWEN